MGTHKLISGGSSRLEVTLQSAQLATPANDTKKDFIKVYPLSSLFLLRPLLSAPGGYFLCCIPTVNSCAYFAKRDC